MLYKQWEGTGFRKPVPSFFGRIASSVRNPEAKRRLLKVADGYHQLAELAERRVKKRNVPLVYCLTATARRIAVNFALSYPNNQCTE